MGVPGFYRWAVRRVPYLRAKSCGLPYEFDNLYLGNWVGTWRPERVAERYVTGKPQGERGKFIFRNLFCFWLDPRYLDFNGVVHSCVNDWSLQEQKEFLFRLIEVGWDGDMLTWRF